MNKKHKNLGSTEIWTRIAGFKVQSANHYTMEPLRTNALSKWIEVFIFLMSLYNPMWKKNVPGWARTTNLSVNSQPR